MDIITKIRMMQAIRNVNETETAELIGTSRQNFSKKIKRDNIGIDTIEFIANALGFDMEIVFTDRETGKKI